MTFTCDKGGDYMFQAFEEIIPKMMAEFKTKDKVVDGKIKVNTRILNLPLSVLIGLAITVVLVALIYLILEVTIEIGRAHV